MGLENRSRLVVFSTKLGWVGVLHFDYVIEWIHAGFSGQADLIEAFQGCAFEVVRADRTETKWGRCLQKFAEGQSVSFLSWKLKLGNVSDFQRRVLDECRRIPYGETVSYGKLGALAGSPRSARAVGGVMGRNRHPWVIPCHRVVGSNGIGGFSSPQGVELKRQLLRLEGAWRECW